MSDVKESKTTIYMPQERHMLDGGWEWGAVTWV